MTALVVVLMFVGFVFLDFAVRAAGRRLAERRDRRVREEVLTTSLRLDFTHEAKSLKRVEVPHPKARILAVDDEPVLLDLIVDALGRDGHLVDTAGGGREALEKLAGTTYDIVLLDLKMPEMDGRELFETIKVRFPEAGRRVIFASGDTIHPETRHFIDGSGRPCIDKPFKLEVLAEAIASVVNGGAHEPMVSTGR